jgi:hypothetical protein
MTDGWVEYMSGSRTIPADLKIGVKQTRTALQARNGR